MGIKDSLLEQTSLCECTWEVITYMVMTNEEHLDPDIWLETLNQGTGTEDIIRTI